MEKGYYTKWLMRKKKRQHLPSQSTIKMEKGYYAITPPINDKEVVVAIHNKNGKGLLQAIIPIYPAKHTHVAIHNKNGKGLLRR